MNADLISTMEALFVFLQEENKALEEKKYAQLRAGFEEKNRLMAQYAYLLGFLKETLPSDAHARSLLREKLTLLQEAIEENHEKGKIVLEAYDQVTRIMQQVFLGRENLPLKGYGSLGERAGAKTRPPLTMTFNRCL